MEDVNGARPAPAEAPPLYRAVEQSLSEAVARGALAPGGVLSEATVTAVFGTSRTPVKLALDRLVEDGVLAKAEGRGFVVEPAGEGKRSRIRRDQLACALSVEPPRRATAAWTTIYDEVEREVTGRSVFGAQRLVESRLAQTYGVSRTVAHEVLMRLERLGLIEKDESSRWSIVAMTAERVRQIYAIRGLIEPAAIAWAGARVPAAELAVMRARLHAVQERYPDVSVQELDLLERDVHVTCIAWCGNSELVKLLRINQALLIHNKHMLGRYLELPQIDPFLSEHAAILDRLILRDGEGAASAMREHLASALPNVLERLRQMHEVGPLPRVGYILPI